MRSVREGQSAKSGILFTNTSTFIISGDPEVRCGSEDISLHFASAKPFMGKIFVKVQKIFLDSGGAEIQNTRNIVQGHVNEAECVQQGDSRTTQSFTIRFDSCGVRRQREVSTEEPHSISCLNQSESFHFAHYLAILTARRVREMKRR